uniref:NADH-ubiquinone oxidoreductase chain 5 n=1 Tax=Cladolidia biungulata TaxID=2983421 RepID=A0A977XT02_9HEMI|nr:NADH dehydrogenase subunit 5 [Cladolidia biungulata]UXW93601.1 NADH dehydrogenase subunit 5 [Cladolidia biungulata]
MINYKVYLVWMILLSFFFFFFFFLGLYFLVSDCTVMLEYSILGLGSVEITYLILLDWISMFFCCLVMIISCMVVLYSLQYMGISSYSSIRFLYLIILFILSMFMLIISPNLISIMLGWDGLGLVSFCLVVYYDSLSSYLSGMITLLTNRLGDIGILICIGWLSSFGGWHFVFNNFMYSTSIFYLVFISSFTKSAQIPFSCWLPAAMSAPTPVSALVHSSTLVTAGLYLIIRFFSFFFYMNYFCMFISLLTVIMSSFCGLFEFDLSKIVAYSTLSQLGLMMFSLFMGLVEFSYFHLLSHAVFKSLLFLCSGIFIYYMGDVQDIRMLGFMCKLFPLTSSCFNISWLSLCGIPFLSGFYSKDFLIDYSLNSGLDIFLYSMMYFSLCLTLFYSFRLFYYTMIMGSSFYVFNFVNDSFDYMKFSVFFLSLFSVLFGCMFNWLIGFDLVLVCFPLYIKLIILLIILFSLWVIYEILNLKFALGICYLNFNTYVWFLNGFIPYFYSNMYVYGSGMYNFLFWGEYYGLMGITYLFPYWSNLVQLVFLGGFNFILLLMMFSFMVMF